MHAEAHAFVERALASLPHRGHVVELGSRFINGSVRPLFGYAASYVGVDLVAGPGVDVVADAASFKPDVRPDLIVSCELLEHTPDGQAIVANAARILAPGGRLLVTCATDLRVPHSGIDGGPLKQGEFYRNVPPDELVEWTKQAGLQVLDRMEVYQDRGDLYVLAGKAE